MKTTININGLDVEFTEEVPTRECACWIYHDKTKRRAVASVSIINEDGEEVAWIESALWDDPADEFKSMGWLFSAPLVPVTEVDRLKVAIETAYAEGHSDAGGSEYDMTFRWKRSDARKVVEGCK